MINRMNNIGINKYMHVDSEEKTMLELYSIILDRMNQVIDTTNDNDRFLDAAIIEFRDKLSYLLHSGMYDEVTKVMKELLKNGMLENIINVDIFNELNTLVMSKQTLGTTDIEYSFNRYEKYNNAYHLIEVPRVNKDGTINEIKKAIHNDWDKEEPKLEYPRETAIEKNAIVGINASGWAYGKAFGLQVLNGKALNQNMCNAIPSTFTMGVNSRGRLKTYAHDRNSVEDLINDDVQNSFCFVCPILDKGIIHDDSVLSTYPRYNEKANRTVIGQRWSDDKIFIVVVEGRRANESGLTYRETAELMKDLDCDYAYMLDGGGSSQLIINGQLENVPVDASKGFVERQTCDTLYIVNNRIDTPLTRKEKHIEKHKQRKILSLFNEMFKGGVTKLYTNFLVPIVSSHASACYLGFYSNGDINKHSGLATYSRQNEDDSYELRSRLLLWDNELIFQNMQGTLSTIFRCTKENGLYHKGNIIADYYKICPPILDTEQLNSNSIFFTGVATKNVPVKRVMCGESIVYDTRQIIKLFDATTKTIYWRVKSGDVWGAKWESYVIPSTQIDNIV